MKPTTSAISLTVSLLLVLGVVSEARAHVSVSSGPAAGDSRSVVTFGIGHGCAGDDTFSVTVDIPAGVTSVRPMPSALGVPTVTRDQTGAVTSVTWEKAITEDLDEDILFYELQIRMRIPDQPFTKLYFPATQTCRDDVGNLTVVEWTSTDGTGEPAPELVVVPERHRGWNRYTVSAEMTDLNAFFADALIVWKGTSAFSANATTAELIAATPGVSSLSALSAGDEIWVKY